MHDLVLKNGYIIDPINNKENYYNIAIKGGKIVEVCSIGSSVKAKKNY